MSSAHGKQWVATVLTAVEPAALRKHKCLLASPRVLIASYQEKNTRTPQKGVLVFLVKMIGLSL